MIKSAKIINHHETKLLHVDMLTAQLVCLFCSLMQRLTSTVPILEQARSTVLRFHQRMLYSHAPLLQPEIVTEINTVVFPSSADTGGSSNSPISDDQRILQALLYTSVGALDVAHEIVQRMSHHDALYVHALLHRLEGKHAGEGGMKGWSNADYWNDQMGSYHPHFSLLCDHSRSLSDQPTPTTTAAVALTDTNTNTNDRVAKFIRQVDQASKTAVVGAKQTGWQPSLFLNLCMDGFRYDDEPCVAFCESVTTHEYRLLLELYCTKCLGAPDRQGGDGFT